MDTLGKQRTQGWSCCKVCLRTTSNDHSLYDVVTVENAMVFVSSYALLLTGSSRKESRWPRQARVRLLPVLTSGDYGNINTSTVMLRVSKL